jgi:peptide/nickel transport system permease protein
LVSVAFIAFMLWHGMGLLSIQAVTFADIPLIALIFVVIKLTVDLLYFMVVPRLRIERLGAH